MRHPKIAFKQTISRAVFGWKSFRSASNKTPSVRALMYHSTPIHPEPSDSFQMTTPVALFEKHMAFLASEKFNVLSTLEMLDRIKHKKALPPKAIVITFDDGFRNNLNVLPILESHQFPATFFLPIQYLNQLPQYLSWQDIAPMATSPLFSFGSHSMSHKNLRSLTNHALEWEMKQSKKQLEDHLNRRIPLFAFPFGSFSSFDSRMAPLLQTLGYEGAFTTLSGVNTHQTPLYGLKRTRLSWIDTLAYFPNVLGGADDWYYLWQKLQS